MTRHDYTLLSIAIAAAFAVLGVLAYRRGGRRGLWWTWVLSVVLIAAFGIWDWRHLPTKETPVSAYLLVAIVPTLVAAAFIQWTARARQPLLMQLVGAGAICWVLMPLMLLVGTYMLGG